MRSGQHCNKCSAQAPSACRTPIAREVYGPAGKNMPRIYLRARRPPGIIGAIPAGESGGADVLLFKSNTHLDWPGPAYLEDLIKLLIEEVSPALILSIGTAGGRNQRITSAPCAPSAPVLYSSLAGRSRAGRFIRIPGPPATPSWRIPASARCYFPCRPASTTCRRFVRSSISNITAATRWLNSTPAA